MVKTRFGSDTGLDLSKVKRAAVKPNIDPPFTVATLRACIPKHCWERSAVTSFYHLFKDLVVIAALYYASTFIDGLAVADNAKSALWVLYWFLQGSFMTGVWVIAHECGHQAFSSSQAINDTVGLIFHSLLLVPYFSWKISHRRHHSNTGSVERDEVFVPVHKSDPKVKPSDLSVSDRYNANYLPGPVVRLGKLVGDLTLGWPLYLLFNVASRPYDGHLWVNHFNPWSPIFSKRERIYIAITDVAFAGVVYCLYSLGLAFGWTWLAKTYGIPLLVTNFWLVMITLLQHTNAALPHYNDKEWDWLRGALATVDRNYGPFLNHVHHHIADTHVLHHLFSQIPFYHAQEATEAIKKVLGKYYNYDSRFIFKALWEDYNCCHVAAPDQANGGILWYKF